MGWAAANLEKKERVLYRFFEKMVDIDYSSNYSLKNGCYSFRAKTD